MKGKKNGNFIWLLRWEVSTCFLKIVSLFIKLIQITFSYIYLIFECIMSRDLVIPINFVQIFYTLQASHRSQITSLCRRLCSWALQPMDFSSRIGLLGPHYLSHFANGLLWSISFPSHFRLLAHALSLSQYGVSFWPMFFLFLCVGSYI